MPEDGPSLTIDELARRSGMTVRNIRAHASRGLLPPPRLRGRTGYYGAEHLARLQLIQGLQQQGFNLAAIHALLTLPRGGNGADETDAFIRTVLGPWLPEAPELRAERDLAAQFGIAPDPALTEELTALGVLEPAGAGQVRVLNPTVLRVGTELAELGFHPQRLLVVLRVLLQHSTAVGDAFVQMFLDVTWADFVAAGMPSERFGELRSLVERLQPLAAQAVVAAFQQVMTERIGAAFATVGAAISERDAAP